MRGALTESSNSLRINIHDLSIRFLSITVCINYNIYVYCTVTVYVDHKYSTRTLYLTNFLKSQLKTGFVCAFLLELITYKVRYNDKKYFFCKRLLFSI